MQPRQRIRLGDLLVEHKLISEGQLTTALEEQKRSGRKLGRVLIENGFVKEDDLLSLLSTQLEVPYVDLVNYDFNPVISQVIPETVARRYRVIALEEGPDGLVVGMADPTNIFAYDELVRILKRPIALAVVKETDLLAGVDKIYQHHNEIQSLASEVSEDIAGNVFDLQKLNNTVGQSEAPVVKLIETIFGEALKLKASDIHIEPDENVLRIRRRIDGVLHEQVMDEKHIAASLVSRLKLMAGLDISERRLPQDGRFDLKIDNKAIDVRVATMPTTTGEAVVMRVLDHSGGVLDLSKVGFSPGHLQMVTKSLHQPHGMILVTGPTGSGKSTTLYSMLNDLNQAEKKIITAEDPVEYQLPRINQVQINTKIGLNFATVLRTALRQDPDVIFIGEIRDRESAEIGLRAAMTGHLVLSSLHTNDAVSTAIRLVDMGIENFLVASAVNMIISQRLVRKICEHCKSKRSLSTTETTWLHGIADESLKNSQFYVGKGCNACNQSGYRGRLAIHEVLDIDETLANLVRLGDYDGFKRAADNKSNFTPLIITGLDLARAGMTSLEEVIRVSGWVD